MARTRDGVAPAFVLSVGDTIQGLNDAATAEADWREWQRIRAPYERLPLYLTPGNHDIWQRSKPNVVGACRRHFAERFPSSLEIRTRGRPILLFGLDSTENTELRHALARGRVSIEQLDLLARRFRATGGLHKEHPLLIVSLHHPLSDPGDKTHYVTMRLDDRTFIAKRLFQGGANLVLAGHLHEWFIRQAESPHLPAQAVVGSATIQVSERSFFACDIYDTRISITPFEYDVSDREFVPKSSRSENIPLAGSLQPGSRFSRRAPAFRKGRKQSL